MVSYSLLLNIVSIVDSDMFTGSKRRLMCVVFMFIMDPQYSSGGPVKLRQFYVLKTLQYIHNRFHKILSVYPQASTLLPHIYNTKSMCTCVYSVYVIMCVCVCVYLCLCVCLHSARCSIRCIFIFFKCDFIACLSYLMWNRVPCSHGSM